MPNSAIGWRQSQTHPLGPSDAGPAQRHRGCGPIRTRRTALPDADLVEIADKDRVDPNLLIKIGPSAAQHGGHRCLAQTRQQGTAAKLIDNPNALISEEGFARVITSLDGDKNLAGAIAARSDVPDELRVWLTKTLTG